MKNTYRAGSPAPDWTRKVRNLVKPELSPAQNRWLQSMRLFASGEHYTINTKWCAS